MTIFTECWSSAAITLMSAAMLDYAIGDPWGWLHPVQVMGWAIDRWSKLTWKYLNQPIFRKISGIGLFLFLVVGSGAGSWLFLDALKSLHPVVAQILEIILLASCLAGRSLRQAAQDVLTPLSTGDVDEARLRLKKYVGRDTDRLTTTEIYRAVLETVAENATDGVTAPWFYALLGASFPAIGPVPLAIAYKAASTLDSMVGYRKEPYADLGWCSAQVEDVLTWLPCRLTVLTLALLSGRPAPVLTICQRDAHQDPSPNSGWSECIYAAILGVQLGGANYYQGELRTKPLLGDDCQTIGAGQIDRALNLTRQVFLIWLFLWLAIRLSSQLLKLPPTH
jgi:adenosylcobinamide-phosphate synthase